MISLLLAFACSGERPDMPGTAPSSGREERGTGREQPGTTGSTGTTGTTGTGTTGTGTTGTGTGTTGTTGTGTTGTGTTGTGTTGSSTGTTGTGTTGTTGTGTTGTGTTGTGTGTTGTGTTGTGTTGTGQARMFEDLDINKDGSVEKTEVSEVATLSRDFSTYDVDKNGKLSRTEFLSWQETVDMPAFADLDTNKDGTLESAEIEKNDMIKRDRQSIDTDKNGQISKEEYQIWIVIPGRG